MAKVKIGHNYVVIACMYVEAERVCSSPIAKVAAPTRSQLFSLSIILGRR